MRFPLLFRRTKNTASSGPAFGTDANPPTKKPQPLAADSALLSTRLRDTNGWPVQRIAIGLKAGSPAAITCDVYFWEDLSESWFKLNTAGVLTLTPGQLIFVDVPTSCEPAPTQKQLDSGAGFTTGSIDVQIVPIDTGGAVADGVYTVVAAADLTTIGT